jgi:hypothetical protein
VRNGSLMASDYVGDVIHVLADGSARREPLYVLHSDRTVTDVACSVGDEGRPVLLGQSFTATHPGRSTMSGVFLVPRIARSRNMV